MRKIILPTVLSIACSVFLPMGYAAGATAAASQSSTQEAKPVEKLQSSLIAVMKAGKTLSYKARYDKLKTVVRNSFDFPFIARMVLGTGWSKLNEEQQMHFVSALGRLSASSYAKEFNGYSGEHFDFISSRAEPGGGLVRYAFKTGDGKTVNFDYQVIHVDGQWKIANVIVDGVSDLALKRGQYRRLLADRGYSGLMAWINKKIDANAS